MATIDTNHRIYDTLDEAQRAAAVLCVNDEDGWIYRAKADLNGSGRAVIEVFDAAGDFVSLFGL